MKSPILYVSYVNQSEGVNEAEQNRKVPVSDNLRYNTMWEVRHPDIEYT